MSYSLGVDLGATTCSAAIRRGPDIEPCAIGEVETTMPAVAVPRADGSMLVGEAADRRSWYEPTFVARTVASRLGEPEPVVIDGQTCDTGALTEALIGTAIERASGAGEWPGHLVLTYPLRHGGAVEELLEQAAARVTTSPVMLVPEPIAAMAKLAHDVELALDTTVVVIDFGGSSFDVCLVRRTATGFDLIGEPASLTFGGIDVDTAVLSHVESMIGDVSSGVPTSDHAGMLGLRRLRAACRSAKEALSSVHETVIDVSLAQVQAQVAIARDDLERGIGATLTEAVDMVSTVVDDAGLTLQDVHVALVVGGSSRIPLLSALVTERTGLPIVADPLPELTVSLGAALFAEENPAEAGPVLPGAVAPLAAIPPAPVSPPDPQPDAAFWGPEPGPVADVGGPPDAGVDVGTAAGAGVGESWDNTWDNSWADARTSVFEPPDPGPGPAAGEAVGQGFPGGQGYPAGPGDTISARTTSDSDPFGAPSAAAFGRQSRRPKGGHEDGDAYGDGDDRKGRFADSTDPRMIVGAIAAGLAIVLLGGFALAAGTGGGDNDPTIAVQEPLPTQATTTTLSTSSSTEPPTTVPETTETTRRRPTTTTTTTRPRPTTTPSTAPPPTEPPPPPPTEPPTTSSSTTTSSTSSTTSTTEQQQR
jgi:actin-like ATPase involved in cell morphogenesis